MSELLKPPSLNVIRSDVVSLVSARVEAIVRQARDVAYWLFVAIVALAPLPFGLTAPLPLAMACAGLALCLASADHTRLSSAHLLRLAPVLGAFAVYACAALLQMSPSAAAWIGAAPVWKELSGTRSGVDAYVSWTAGGPWLALGPAFLLVLSLLTAATLSLDRDRAMQLLKVVAISGTCYALYGILAHQIDPHKLLWRDKTAYLDAVTGTFVNRNTAATYWGSCAVVCMALALTEVDDRLRRRRGRRHLSGWLLALGICLVATAMTGSRAGGVATLAALAVGGGLWLAGGVYRGRSRWVMAGAGVFALIFVAQMLGGLVRGRVQEYGFFDQRRIEAYGDTLRMIADHPWLGVGLGNFATVFPRYRSEHLGSSGVWDRAHSTPLEIAAEMGLPVTIAITCCCLWIVYALLTGCLRRRRDRGIPVAGAGVAMLGMLHSSVDFSLQIAGYAVVFGAVVGCGLVQSVSTRGVTRSQSDVVTAE